MNNNPWIIGFGDINYTFQESFRMRYLASNFADINRIVISTATSIFILVTWVFPSLKKKPQTNTKINYT